MVGGSGGSGGSSFGGRLYCGLKIFFNILVRSVGPTKYLPGITVQYPGTVKNVC